MSDYESRLATPEETAAVHEAIERLSEALDGMPEHLAIAALQTLTEALIDSLDPEPRAFAIQRLREFTVAIPLSAN